MWLPGEAQCGILSWGLDPSRVSVLIPRGNSSLSCVSRLTVLLPGPWHSLMFWKGLLILSYSQRQSRE